MTHPAIKHFESFYPPIGRAIVAWALIEIKIDELLLAMLMHKKSRAIARRSQIERPKDIPKGFRSRLKLCNRLAPLFYSKDVVADMKSITNSCDRKILSRNRLAHGEWLVHFLRKRPPRVVCRIRRFGLHGPETPFTVKQIDDIAQAYRTLSERINSFLISHHPGGPLSERLRKLFGIRQRSRKKAGRPPKRAKRP